MKGVNENLNAEEQVHKLNPMLKKSEEYRKLCDKVDEMKQMHERIDLYFASRKYIFLETELTRLRVQLNSITDELGLLNLKIEEKRSSVGDLRIQLQRNDIGSRISDLEREIKDKSGKKAVCQKEAEKYNKLAREIRFIANPEKELFEQQRLQADIREKELSTDIDYISRSIYDNDNQQNSLNLQKKELDETILQLSRNKNNITGRVAEIRQEILNAVGATEKEIPFIGELIQIRSEHKEQWEMAIERVLHNFALQMIVPSAYYKQVTTYVNENNLRGRIVYIQYKEKMSSRSMLNDFEDSLLSKLELNPKSEYVDWVESSLKERFNFLCTDDLQLFRQSHRAVTSKGLIKNDSRHEKDDRKKIFDRSVYILGWDNKEKLQFVISSLKEIGRAHV